MLLKHFSGVKMCLAIRDWQVALNSKVEFSEQCKSQHICTLLLVYSKFESLILKLNRTDTNPQILVMMA